jgi:hypothetical protein
MKRPAILLFVLAFIVSFFWIGCTREELTSVCVTQNMSYKYNIVPILKHNCYSCHSAGNSVVSSGIRLDNYDSLMVYINGNFGGYLVADITHESGYVGMPYMAPKLDTCSINQIKSWIDDNAPDN